MEVTPAALAKLEDCLLNTSGDHPLHNRFRALFTLKAVGGEKAIDIVSRGAHPFLFSSLILLLRGGPLPCSFASGRAHRVALPPDPSEFSGELGLDADWLAHGMFCVDQDLRTRLLC